MRTRGLLAWGIASIMALAIAAAILLLVQPPVHAQEAAIFTVNATTLESHYPRGMTFTIDAASSAGEITRATLFYELRTGLRERANASQDAAGRWVAEPYRQGGGLPPWVDFHYWWLLTDSAGNTFETEKQYGIYEDNTRDWWSIDTEDITLYWFGEMPELGEQVAATMAEMREYFTLGWGRTLSYKPLAILFPPGDIWNEYVAGGVNPNAAGFTNPAEGFTVQSMGDPRSPERHEELRTQCGGYWYGNRENTPEQWRVQDTVHTIVHETVHLYQSDFNRSGPFFWTEGQADYFSSLSGWRNRDSEARMIAYGAAGYELPTLQGDQLGGGATRSADGCHALGYAVGESFIRFIVTNYGGLETHRRIVEAMPGRGVEGAIAAVLGKPFVEVENEFRALYGLPPVELLPTPTPFALPALPIFATPTPFAPGN